MIAVLVALVAFFAPITAGLVLPWHTPGVWLFAALAAVGVCTFFGQPLAFAVAIQGVILAVIAVGVYPPPPPRRLPWRYRQQLRAFRKDLKAFGHHDLEHAEQYDPKPGDKRVALGGRDLIRVAEVRSALASGGARRARQAVGLSVCDIASAVGVSAALVSQWEQHHRVPGAVDALAYGRALDKADGR